jgi:hypothetical protein
MVPFPSPTLAPAPADGGGGDGDDGGGDAPGATADPDGKGKGKDGNSGGGGRLGGGGGDLTSASSSLVLVLAVAMLVCVGCTVVGVRCLCAGKKKAERESNEGDKGFGDMSESLDYDMVFGGGAGGGKGSAPVKEHELVAMQSAHEPERNSISNPMETARVNRSKTMLAAGTSQSWNALFDANETATPVIQVRIAEVPVLRVTTAIVCSLDSPMCAFHSFRALSTDLVCRRCCFCCCCCCFCCGHACLHWKGFPRGASAHPVRAPLRSPWSPHLGGSCRPRNVHRRRGINDHNM